MIFLFLEMMSYPFLSRAIVVGGLISISAALLGIVLVAKRYTMIGNSLSHVGFACMAFSKALALDAIVFSMPIMIVVAFLLLKLNENSKIKADQMLGIISVTSLAFGVMSIYNSTGLNTDVCNYLFGSILAMKSSDVLISIVIALFIIVLFVLYYNEVFAISYDEDFAKARGIKVDVFNFCFSALTALVIIVGMRIMGALLISSLIILPSISANRLFYSFKAVSIGSAFISIVAFVVGISLSYLFAFPTGASIVFVNVVVLLVFVLIEKILARRKI